jgi:hypothetical protein
MELFTEVNSRKLRQTSIWKEISQSRCQVTVHSIDVIIDKILISVQALFKHIEMLAETSLEWLQHHTFQHSKVLVTDDKNLELTAPVKNVYTI